jgi:bifunctional UDP-N-acetylglucosamine pyrophosphorylase/glucosamine-1-phosphate N-acetyltransferase
MLWYPLEATRQATGANPVVVIGHGAEAVQEMVGDSARFVIQEEQLGTGHAVLQTESTLRDHAELVLVTNADNPLITVETLNRLIETQREGRGAMTMLTVDAEDPRGFGRVVRGPDAGVQAIVEEAQATPKQREIRELNVGTYCFSAAWLWDALPRIPLSSKGEHYLTDLVAIAREDGHRVDAVRLEDPRHAIGINTRVHLAEAEAILRERVNRAWMMAGVTLIDPGSTFIDAGVTIGQDTVIWPNTHIQGDTHVGRGCSLGPNTVVRDTHIGDRCRVLSSVLEEAVMEDDVEIGPFGHLRKGAHLAEGVHLGNFGEIKNAYLGPGTKMGHFSYIGDAEIGAQVNIGAGTITCNYDGRRKHKTRIEDGVFIGSDTMLVAPVTLGEGARTGAGAVVTRDLAPRTLAVGVPARPLRKLDESD